MSGRRRNHEEAHGNHERWLLTYADLVTLLLVFFIVMYAMGQSDLARFTQVAASLQRAFNVPVLQGEGRSGLDGSGGPLLAEVPSPAPQMQAKTEPPGSGVPNPEPPGSSVLNPEPVRSSLYEAIRADLAAYAENRGLDGRVWVEADPEGVLITISGELLFQSGRADLQPSARELLWVAAARLPGLENEVRIAGHTDNVAINTPQFPSNWELSTARAMSVLHFMRQQMRIEPNRLVVLGYGEHQPIAQNTTPDGRARNRRVELMILEPGM